MRYLLLVLLMTGSTWGVTTFYADWTNGNDTIASAAGYAYTASTKTITKVGAFASYTYHAGDQIQVTVTGASSKVDVAFYTIASRVSDDAITLTTDASGTEEDDTNVTLTGGNNGTAATTAVGTLNGPKKTVNAAIALVAANGDIVQIADSTAYAQAASFFVVNKQYSYTIQGNASNRAAVQLNGTTGQSYAFRLYTSGNENNIVTIKNLTIQGANHAVVFMSGAAAAVGGVIFDNCVINAAVNQLGFNKETSTATRARAATFQNGTAINCSGSGSGMNIVDLLTLTVSPTCTITCAAGNGIALDGNIGSVSISGATIYNTDAWVFTAASIDATCDSINILNNTLTSAGGSGINIPVYATKAKLIGNTLTVTANTNEYGIAVGLDAQANANPLGVSFVEDNILTMGGTGTHHSLLIGGGADGAKCVGNTITYTGTTAGYGIVVKPDNCYVAKNTIVAPSGIFVKGARYNTVEYNTAVCHGSYAVSGMAALMLALDDIDNSYNSIQNNIFTTSDAYAVIIASNGGAHGNTRLDYNCYYAATAPFYRVDTTTAYTLSAMQTLWASWGDWATNDAHSKSENPQFVNATAGNFKLMESSPCIDTGMPTPNSGVSTMGAYGRASKAGSLDRFDIFKSLFR